MEACAPARSGPSLLPSASSSTAATGVSSGTLLACGSSAETYLWHFKTVYRFEKAIDASAVTRARPRLLIAAPGQFLLCIDHEHRVEVNHPVLACVFQNLLVGTDKEDWFIGDEVQKKTGHIQPAVPHLSGSYR